MDGQDDLEIQAEKLRSSGALGRSPVVHRLFDYLLSRSGDDAAPKEIEVAQAVFGRAGGFDISQDSTVRVYVHRLRGKIDEFYRGPGRDEIVRLTIPKGEYRIVAAAAETAVAVEPASRSLVRQLAIALVAVTAISLAGFSYLWLRHEQTGFDYARRSAAWSGIFKNDRPITVVVGDYYIFGEADDHFEIKRLIREYDINSPKDLENYVMDNPGLMGRYTNLDLHYLPISSASALKSLTPIFASTAKDRARLRVINASDLTPEILKNSNIVYLGYISGLGLLREPVFSGSRFKIGETYDEIIDNKGGGDYISQEGGPEMPNETRRDYALFSTFPGPNGARIAVVTGTRDVGLAQLADILASRAGLDALNRATNHDRAFEALYQVEAINRQSMRGRLLTVSPLKESAIWTANAQFPMR